VSPKLPYSDSRTQSKYMYTQVTKPGLYIHKLCIWEDIHNLKTVAHLRNT